VIHSTGRTIQRVSPQGAQRKIALACPVDNVCSLS
jgi:hypothetical protein